MDLGDGLLPYENFSGTSIERAVIRADEALESGWTHSGRYAPIGYRDGWPWLDSIEKNSARNFHLHAWDMVSDLLLAHRAAGNRRYYDESLSVALDWIRRFPLSKCEGQPEYAWYDMAVGLRAHRLAYILDAGKRLYALGREEADTLFASLEQHRLYLEDDANIIFGNNHGFYQVLGQLAMARRFAAEYPDMEKAKLQGELRLRRMIDAQFTSEGIHREHSPDYHRMVYVSLRGALAEKLICDESLISLIERIEEALAWFVTPDGMLARFGDSDERSVLYKAKDVERLWMTPAMRYASSRGYMGEPPAESSRAFKDSGYFVAKDRWHSSDKDFSQRGYLAQIAAFHSRAHKHADDLSFVWYEQGCRILVDAGRYGYFGKAEAGSDLWSDGYWYSDPARVYIESTRAHNTVEIDGRNHPRKGVKPYGSAINRSGETGQGIIFCESEVRHRSVRFIRTLIWLPGRWLLVFDWLQDGLFSRHDFSQWFHFSPEIDVSCMNHRVEATVPGLGRKLVVLPLLDKGGVLLRAQTGPNGEPLQGYYSPSESQLEPNYALGYEKKDSRRAVFATLFALGDVDFSSRISQASGSGQGLKAFWRQDGKEYCLSMRRKPEMTIELMTC